MIAPARILPVEKKRTLGFYRKRKREVASLGFYCEECSAKDGVLWHVVCRKERVE